MSDDGLARAGRGRADPGGSRRRPAPSRTACASCGHESRPRRPPRRTVPVCSNGSTVQPAIEQLAADKVRLTVDVPAHDVHHAVEHAASDLAQSARIPGFRKGKVPLPGARATARQGAHLTRKQSTLTSAAGSGTRRRARGSIPLRNRSTTTNYRRATTPTGGSSPRSRCSRNQTRRIGLELEVPREVVEVPEEAVQAELQAVQATAAELDAGRRPARRQDGDVAVVDLLRGRTAPAQRDYVVELGTGSGSSRRRGTALSGLQTR